MTSLCAGRGGEEGDGEVSVRSRFRLPPSNAAEEPLKLPDQTELPPATPP